MLRSLIDSPHQVLYLSPPSTWHAFLCETPAEDPGGPPLVHPSYFYTSTCSWEHRHRLGLPDEEEVMKSQSLSRVRVVHPCAAAGTVQNSMPEAKIHNESWTSTQFPYHSLPAPIRLLLWLNHEVTHAHGRQVHAQPTQMEKGSRMLEKRLSVWINGAPLPINPKHKQCVLLTSFFRG